MSAVGNLAFDQDESFLSDVDSAYSQGVLTHIDAALGRLAYSGRSVGLSNIHLPSASNWSARQGLGYDQRAYMAEMGLRTVLSGNAAQYSRGAANLEHLSPFERDKVHKEWAELRHCQQRQEMEAQISAGQGYERKEWHDLLNREAKEAARGRILAINETASVLLQFAENQERHREYYEQAYKLDIERTERAHVASLNFQKEADLCKLTNNRLSATWFEARANEASHLAKSFDLAHKMQTAPANEREALAKAFAASKRHDDHYAVATDQARRSAFDAAISKEKANEHERVHVGLEQQLDLWKQEKHAMRATMRKENERRAWLANCREQAILNDPAVLRERQKSFNYWKGKEAEYDRGRDVTDRTNGRPENYFIVTDKANGASVRDYGSHIKATSHDPEASRMAINALMERNGTNDIALRNAHLMDQSGRDRCWLLASEEGANVTNILPSMAALAAYEARNGEPHERAAEFTEVHAKETKAAEAEAAHAAAREQAIKDGTAVTSFGKDGAKAKAAPEEDQAAVHDDGADRTPDGVLARLRGVHGKADNSGIEAKATETEKTDAKVEAVKGEGEQKVEETKEAEAELKADVVAEEEHAIQYDDGSDRTPDGVLARLRGVHGREDSGLEAKEAEAEMTADTNHTVAMAEEDEHEVALADDKAGELEAEQGKPLETERPVDQQQDESKVNEAPTVQQAPAHDKPIEAERPIDQQPTEAKTNETPTVQQAPTQDKPLEAERPADQQQDAQPTEAKANDAPVQQAPAQDREAPALSQSHEKEAPALTQPAKDKPLEAERPADQQQDAQPTEAKANDVPAVQQTQSRDKETPALSHQQPQAQEANAPTETKGAELDEGPYWDRISQEKKDSKLDSANTIMNANKPDYTGNRNLTPLQEQGIIKHLSHLSPQEVEGFNQKHSTNFTEDKLADARAERAAEFPSEKAISEGIKPTEPTEAPTTQKAQQFAANVHKNDAIVAAEMANVIDNGHKPED